jgi:hypothetical protein
MLDHFAPTRSVAQSNPLRLLSLVNVRARQNITAHQCRMRKATLRRKKARIDPIDAVHPQQQRIVLVRRTPKHFTQHLLHASRAIERPGPVLSLPLKRDGRRRKRKAMLIHHLQRRNRRVQFDRTRRPKVRRIRRLSIIMPREAVLPIRLRRDHAHCRPLLDPRTHGIQRSLE